MFIQLKIKIQIAIPMSKKKSYKSNTIEPKVNEPIVDYGTNRIQIFKSFEEQAAYELEQMVKLSPEQILEQLRKFINIAYGMHGYNPDNLPKTHSIQIISK
jgi:hypothetical protein